MAKVGKRKWTYKGEQKSASVVVYRDLRGVRRQKTFKSEAEAEDFAATTHIDLKHGIPDRDSVTVIEAGELWLASNEEDGLEVYSVKRNRQHLEGHISPRIGRLREQFRCARSA